MRSAWLLRGGQVLGAADMAETAREALRGFSGRPDPDIALVLERPPIAHTFGAAAPVDAAYLDHELRVTAIVRMDPRLAAWPWRRAHTVVQVSAGTFARWDLQVGDCLELRIPA